ncbi:MAG TPA: hypothetical protein VJR06_07820, partial [Nitrososphaerales archaeon]|nr:hypothetical protein [Nitrososphaerales archaeon]
IALQETLATIDDRLSRPTGAEEEQFLRARKTAVEQDLRKLKWSIRESGLESLRGAGGQEGLRPLPTKQSPRQLRRADRAERDHLLRSLGEAEEVLASEPLGSAGARLALIAADVRAHYRLLKGLETTSRNLGDYAIAWAVLASVSMGAGLDRRVSSHASTRIRGRLEGLCGTAIARGLVGARADGSEGGQGMAERWK